MKNDLRNKVVVITGASSGIGRATAVAFARHGACVVLAARRSRALQEVAAECEREGSRCVISVPTDVSNQNSIEHLAQAAVDRFGRIDVWINNAGVYLLGKFQDVPIDTHRRLLEVNYFGVVHGCLAALRHMREQGSGTIINTASLASKAAYAYASAYCASKHAVRALSDALRQELYGAGIHVCCVHPATIDTPLFYHSANYSGRQIKTMRPVYTPEAVAQTMVELAQSPQRERFVGNIGRVMSAMKASNPALQERMMATMVTADHFEKRSAPDSDGNLFSPSDELTSTRAGWKARERRRTMREAGIGAAAAIPAALGAWWYFTRKRPASSKRPEAA